jgi:predicted Co/Zn/Cd cation transporter (cation efflux family)
MQGMDRAGLAIVVVAVLVGLTGAVFIGQGLGIITGGSVMVGDRTWAVIGAVMVVLAIWVARRTLSRRTH